MSNHFLCFFITVVTIIYVITEIFKYRIKETALWTIIISSRFIIHTCGFADIINVAENTNTIFISYDIVFFVSIKDHFRVSWSPICFKCFIRSLVIWNFSFEIFFHIFISCRGKLFIQRTHRFIVTFIILVNRSVFFHIAERMFQQLQTRCTYQKFALFSRVFKFCILCNVLIVTVWELNLDTVSVLFKTLQNFCSRIRIIHHSVNCRQIIAIARFILCRCKSFCRRKKWQIHITIHLELFSLAVFILDKDIFFSVKRKHIADRRICQSLFLICTMRNVSFVHINTVSLRLVNHVDIFFHRFRHHTFCTYITDCSLAQIALFDKV